MPMHIESESWEYKVPFRVSRGAEASLGVIVVTLVDSEGHVGRGEAAGVDYDGETVPLMLEQIEGVRSAIERGLDLTADRGADRIADRDAGGSTERGNSGIADRDAGGIAERGEGRIADRDAGGAADRDTGGAAKRGVGGAALGRALDFATLAALLPAGGARNAVDCALWDLTAKQRGVSVWQLAGMPHPRPLVTCVTLGIDTDAAVAAGARQYARWPLIKVKVDGERHLEAVRLVHAACPEAQIIVDPNQAWSCDLLNRLASELKSLGVVLIEQPVPRGEDESLRGYSGLVRLAADESVADRAGLASVKDLYQVVNVKLDKTGGLTEALALAREARALGLQVMVGCMAGTSLAMAPGMVVGQLAEFVDLDGPLLHTRDRAAGIEYDRGVMQLPAATLWG